MIYLSAILVIIGVAFGFVGFRSKSVEWNSLGTICEGVALIFLIAERIIK